MKLSDGETPLMRKPRSSKSLNRPIRPEMVALLVQMLERNHKLKLQKPISPRIQ
jgi:hypothetical protein